MSRRHREVRHSVVYTDMENDDELEEEEKQNKKMKILATAAAIASKGEATVTRRLPKCEETLYGYTLKKILDMKKQNPGLFQRMYRLTPTSFDHVLRIIRPSITPRRPGGTNIVPPEIKLCLDLRMRTHAGPMNQENLFSFEMFSDWVKVIGLISSVAIEENNSRITLKRILIPCADRKVIGGLAIIETNFILNFILLTNIKHITLCT